MAFASVRALLLLLAITAGGTQRRFANALAGPSLRVEMVPGGALNGCCSPAFYNATSQELFDFVNTTTAQALQLLGVSMSNLVINPFILVNTNLCLTRERSLLRGSDQTQDETLQRQTKGSTNQYSSSCSACTKSSCSSYCSGCYLCSSNRRELERDLQLLGGLVGGLLGVTTTVLNTAFAAVSNGITPHFINWLTSGAGGALANGCMGTPSELLVYSSLVY